MRRITFDPDAIGTEDYITNLQFSRDGKTLAGIVRTNEYSGDLRIVRVDWQQEMVLPNAHDFDIAVDTVDDMVSVVWCPDLEVMAEHYQKEDGFFASRLVDFWSKPIIEVELPEDLSPSCFAFSTDGSLFFLAGSVGPEFVIKCEVRTYSVELLLEEDEDALLETLRPDVHGFSSLASSPNGRWLAWGCGQGEVILHDNSGEQADQMFETFGQQARSVEGLQFSPKSDGLLALVNWTVAVWSMGDLEAKVVRCKSLFRAASYLPDGQVLAATKTGDVVWIDAKTGTELKRLNFDIGQVTGLAVAPDGLTAALGCVGGSVVLFDLD